MTTLTATPPVAAASAPADPGVEVPLVDWGSLALRAGRVGPILPHMAWLLRFDDAVAETTLAAESRRLAATPYGLGRRICPPRLPGGRYRWRQERRSPPVVVRSRPLAGSDAMSAWLDRELAIPLDPEYDAGWRMSAAPLQDGGTVVLVTAHHLFGTGGGILGALYGDGSVDPTAGTTESPFAADEDFTIWREAAGVAERVRLGVAGAARLAEAAASTLGSRRAAPRADRDGDPPAGGGSAGAVSRSAGQPAVRPPRGRDRTRRPPSTLRVAAIATVPAADWDTAAAARSGTGNTLLAAVAANLLRRARRARGGPVDRTLRLLLPVDLSDREVARAVAASGPAPAMTTAEVVVAGGPPAYRELTSLRAAMKAAFIRDSGSTPAVRGAGDVMRLLPEPLTFRAAARAAVRFDGCASNVGEVPPAMLQLGPHTAVDAAMLGFPIGNEAITALIRHRDAVAVTVVTDPLRLGPAADLRAWLAEELAGWGIPAAAEVVW